VLRLQPTAENRGLRRQQKTRTDPGRNPSAPTTARNPRVMVLESNGQIMRMGAWLRTPPAQDPACFEHRWRRCKQTLTKPWNKQRYTPRKNSATSHTSAFAVEIAPMALAHQISASLLFKTCRKYYCAVRALRGDWRVLRWPSWTISPKHPPPTQQLP
jgi:hypothetical protein